MNYPKNYAVLTADEMEYTEGGSALGGVLIAAGAAGAVVSSIIYSVKLNQIMADLKAEHPEEYPDTDDTVTSILKNQKLTMEARLQLEGSSTGIGINVAEAVSGLCFGVGMVEVILTSYIKKL